jgi:hypothetical protein
MFSIFRKRSFQQAFFVGTAATMASLDFLTPGYMAFKNPVDYFPWEKEAINLINWGCSGKEVMPIGSVPMLSEIFKANGAELTKVLFERQFGPATCSDGKEKKFSWNLDKFGIHYWIRIKFDENDKASSYEILR